MAAAKPTPLQAYLGVESLVDKEMARVLLDAAKEAESIVLRLAGSKGAADTFERAKMRRAASELRKLSAQMYGTGVTRTMKQGMKKAAEAAVNSETFVSDVLQKTFGASIPALEQAFAYDAATAAEAVYARAQNGIPLSAQVYRTKALTDGTVDRILNRGILLQQSAAQIASAVRGSIDPNVKGGVSYAANRLARTELNNAFHTAQVHRRADEPWTKGFKWHLSGSHPVPDECNQYAERTHFKGGDPGVFKPDAVPGKPHPQCLCYLTTETIGEDDFIDGFLNGEYNSYMDEKIYASGLGTVC